MNLYTLTRGLTRTLTRTLLRPPSAGGGGADASYASVAYLMDLEGADAATTYTEQSSAAATCTFAATAALSNARPGTGVTALELASADYISVPRNGTMETGDFTLEATVTLDVTTGFPFFLSQWNETGNQRDWYWGFTAGAMYIGLSVDGVGSSFRSYAWIPSVTVAYQIAIERYGDTFYFYTDGTMFGTADATGFDSFPTSTALFKVGFDSTHPLDGSVDDVRVTYGVARYQGASYTPAVAAFPTS